MLQWSINPALFAITRPIFLCLICPYSDILFYASTILHFCLELGVSAHNLLLMPWCFGIVIAALQGPQTSWGKFLSARFKALSNSFKPFGCTSWLLALSGLWLKWGCGVEGTAMIREPVCQRNRFLKFVYHAAMEWLHCPGKGISDNGVSCRNSNKSACRFCFSCFFFLSSVLQTFVACCLWWEVLSGMAMCT